MQKIGKERAATVNMDTNQLVRRSIPSISFVSDAAPHPISIHERFLFLRFWLASSYFIMYIVN